MDDVFIVGAGIAGLATALSLGRHNIATHVFEQTDSFGEVGAGIGLGPNAMRCLQAWGVQDALEQRGFRPSALQVFDARDARSLGVLPLADSMEQRYGAPYLTVHRADLHQVLLEAVKRQGLTQLHLQHALHTCEPHAQHVKVVWRHALEANRTQTCAALLGADGINSVVRQQVWGEQALQASGHWAYRTLLPRQALPIALRGDEMGLWLGPRLHVVHYPVRGGEWLNVVVLVESDDKPTSAGWDMQRSDTQTAQDLFHALTGTCSRLQDLVHMAEHWRAWALFDRAPLQSADHMAKNRAALLGDAAHPMLPYLAQGAGMAIEDAHALAQQWQHKEISVEQRLQAYAQSRWQRVARVQRSARRNASVFHAKGVLAWARNTAMRVGGDSLMDMPWLYGDWCGGRVVT